METLGWIIYLGTMLLLFYGVPILVVAVLIVSVVNSITKDNSAESSPKDEDN